MYTDSSQVIWSVSHDLFINNYTKYLIIKLSLLKKAFKKAKKPNYYPIFNRCHCGTTRVAHVHG
jgi:hypothetical protein